MQSLQRSIVECEALGDDGADTYSRLVRHTTGCLTNNFVKTFTMSSELTLSAVRGAVNSTTLASVVVACANWKKSSLEIARELKLSYAGNDSVQVIILTVDEDDEIEEIALSLQMKDVPCVNIYIPGGRLFASLTASQATTAGVYAAISAVQSGRDRNTPPSCCSADGPACCSEEDYYDYVSSTYADVVNKKTSCCNSVDASLCNYTDSDMNIAKEANLGLGCGNPLSFAALQRGESVLDLGSGAGIDCFLAGEQVGPTGAVIGVDMTPR